MGALLTYLGHRLEQSTSDGLFVGQGYFCNEQGACCKYEVRSEHRNNGTG